MLAFPEGLATGKYNIDITGNFLTRGINVVVGPHTFKMYPPGKEIGMAQFCNITHPHSSSTSFFLGDPTTDSDEYMQEMYKAFQVQVQIQVQMISRSGNDLLSRYDLTVAEQNRLNKLLDKFLVLFDTTQVGKKGYSQYRVYN